MKFKLDHFHLHFHLGSDLGIRYSMEYQYVQKRTFRLPKDAAHV